MIIFFLAGRPASARHGDTAMTGEALESWTLVLVAADGAGRWLARKRAGCAATETQATSRYNAYQGGRHPKETGGQPYSPVEPSSRSLSRSAWLPQLVVGQAFALDGQGGPLEIQEPG